MELAYINGTFVNLNYIDKMEIKTWTIVGLKNRICDVIISEFDDDGFNDENGVYHAWDEIKNESNLNDYLINKKHSWKSSGD